MRCLATHETTGPAGILLRTLRNMVAVAAVSTMLLAPGDARAQEDGSQLLPGDTGPTSQSTLAEQGVLKSQHGDWRILCEAAAGPGAERCALVQNVESAERPGFGLVVMILKTPDNKTRMRVAVPLGIFLPPGLGLRVDGEEIGNAPFWFCRPFACETEAIVTDEILDRLKKGSEALFILFERPEKGTGLIVSLNGFSAGHEALGVWQPPAPEADSGGTDETDSGDDPAEAPAQTAN